MKTTITLCLFAFFLATSGLAQWSTIGTPGFTAGEAYYLRLAVDGETPYVAYKDPENGNRLSVMTYDGSVWTYVGSAGFSPGAANNVSIDVMDGVPYVSFSDGANFQKAVVYKYADTAWVNVGGVVDNATCYGSKLITRDSTLYVASLHGNGPHAYELKNNVWAQITYTGASQGSAQDIDMVLDEDHKIYVSYRDNYNDGKATVATPGVNTWSSVGPLGFSTNQVRSTQMALKDGIPYITFRDVVTDRITVMKYDGGWATVGSASFSQGSIVSPDICVYDNRVHVVFSDLVDDDKCGAMFYNGASWEDLPSGASTGRATGQQVVANENGMFVAYYDHDHNGKVTVVKYETCNIDDDVTQVGATLTVDEADASYQWIDCGAFASIPGATNQSFTATANGDYAVEVVSGACIDTSSCVSVTNVGLQEHAMPTIKLYPQPATDMLHVACTGVIFNMQVVDMLGRVREVQNAPSIDISALPSGLYFLQVQTDQGAFVKEFMVQ